MSASELSQLKACVGGMIAMTSFVSTTKQLSVAEVFAGNGEGQPEMESVIFEFIIDESVHDYERSPFADISAFSSEPDEEVGLLCPGTVLQVESVKMKGQVTWVCVRMCQREENEVQRQLFIGWSDPSDVESHLAEQVSLGQLCLVLWLTGRFHQAEEILKLIRLLVNSLPGAATDPRVTFWCEVISLHCELKQLDYADVDHDHRQQTIIAKVQKAVRSVLDSRPFEDRFSDPFLSPISLIDDVLHMTKSDQDNIDVSKLCMEFFKRMQAGCRMDIQPICNMIQKSIVETHVGTEKLTAQSPEVEMHGILGAYNDKQLSEKNPQRIEWCWQLANDAYKKSDYDRAIQLLRESLAIPSNKVHHAKIYRRLYWIYHKQGNWLAAFECCQNIISMPQLPPNSSFIVDAYLKCGRACTQLEDYSEALLSYTKALELQEQHHPPRHPGTADIHVQLGSLFSIVSDLDAAFYHWQNAIALDFPQSTSQAHEQLARVYKRKKQFDAARAHLLQCLDIRRRHFPSETVELVESYLLLIEIEHITGHQQQRDLYLQQASRLTDSSGEARDLFSEETRRILDIPSPTTR